MPPLVEFLVGAALIYFFESIFLVPLRVPLLRRRGASWRVIASDALFSLRTRGIVPMRPWPGDRGLVPCDVPPAVIDAEGETLYLEERARAWSAQPMCSWEDVQFDDKSIRFRQRAAPLISARSVLPWRTARSKGLTVTQAVPWVWARAFSVRCAAAERRRWKLVSATAVWQARILMLWFFVAMPLIYLFGDFLVLALAGLACWGMMLMIAGWLWWLGSRVYPLARSGLRQDAWLAAILPFHAMRAVDHAGVHAMAGVHPVALILVDPHPETHPWLADFARRLAFPRAAHAADLAFQSCVEPIFERALMARGIHSSALIGPPQLQDQESAAFCPRCHSQFTRRAVVCADCDDMKLKAWPTGPSVAGPNIQGTVG